MRADVVFMGGGLAALIAGIKLLKEGKSVIIISAGQSALHFSSGSLCLLNRFEDKDVERPWDCLDRLPQDHPYSKVGGKDAVRRHLEEAMSIFKDAGVELYQSPDRNHYRLTPFGLFSPAWMTLTDHLTVDNLYDIPFHKISIIGIDGFLDFYPDFLAKGLSKLGIECVQSSVNIREFNILRNNPTEMRAPNIARALTEDGLKDYAQVINRRIYDCDIAIIPAVVGLNDTHDVKLLNSLVDCPLYSVSTIPVAVPGIRMKILLQQYFTSLGGWYLLGDSVTDGKIEDDELKFINTSNLGNTSVRADNFILATGGLFSRGLKSDSNHIYEPIFNLDVTGDDEREKWYDRNFYHSQPFLRYGVKTDESFRCFLRGHRINNLYAIGSVMGGDFDPLKDGVGAGVTLASALSVAQHLINT